MLGYPPAMLSYRLRPVLSPPSASATVPDKEARVRACPDIAEWIRRRFGCDACEAVEAPCRRHRDGRRDDFVWREYWRDIPYEMLAQVFSYEELVKLWFDESVIMSKLSDYFEEHEPLLWKVKHSCWRYGWDDDYNLFVRSVASLERVGRDLPAHFSTSITHTRSINTAAWSAHVNSYDPKVGIYLDGPFGILLYYKGAHVMTIGFSISRHGVAIAQVQLRHKHGNRFLYKLPMPYIDFAIDLVSKAFVAENLWIVDGASTVRAIKRAYGKEVAQFDDAAAPRIQQFYDQPLRDYVRMPVSDVGPHADDGRTFIKLARKS